MTRTTLIERFRPSFLSYLAIVCLAGTVVSTAEAQQESRRRRRDADTVKPLELTAEQIGQAGDHIFFHLAYLVA